MEFQRARTTHQIEQRQLDIMNACETLFDKGGYINVNLKVLSEITTISRPAIYNYYKTKDEIILDLLQREFLQWQQELIDWAQKKGVMDKQTFCTELSENLYQKKRMLSYYTLLFTNLEQNCRLEKLVTFKKNIFPLMDTIIEILRQNFNFSKEKALIVSRHIFAYILGIFPMTHMTEKQNQAMNEAGTQFAIPDFKTMCFSALMTFLS